MQVPANGLSFRHADDAAVCLVLETDAAFSVHSDDTVVQLVQDIAQMQSL